MQWIGSQRIIIKKGPLNPKYIRAEVRIGLLTREVIRTSSNRPDNRNRRTVCTGSRPRQNYRDSSSQGNSRGYGRQNSRGEYRNDVCNDYNRSRNRSEKGHLQEVMVIIGIEIPVTVDQGQDLELV